MGSSVQTQLSQSSPVLSGFILPFDSYSAFPSSLFSSPSLDNRERVEGMEGEKAVINRPDAMWLHQIQPSSRQELICLNPSHCSTATIWMPGQRRIGLLRCNLCCLRSSWLVTLSRYLRRGAVFTGAGGQRGHWGVKWRIGVARIQVFGVLVSCYTSLRKVNKFRTSPRLRGKTTRQKEEVRKLNRETRVQCASSLFALLFCVRARPSVRP